MMKKFLSLTLAFILLLQTVPVMADEETSIELVQKLSVLNEMFSLKCLPKGVKKENLNSYYEKNGLTEECWRIMSEVNEGEIKLQQLRMQEEQTIKCESGCSSVEKLLSHAGLVDIEKIRGQLSCTEEKKQENLKNCASDSLCVLESSAMLVGGYAVDHFFPKFAKPKNCDLGNDSCVTQIVTEFLRALFGLFKSMWSGLKAAGTYIEEKTVQFWDFVTNAEDHSSTSQLALAKASEDEGIFKELINDFPGTVSKIWEGLSGALKHWMKTDIYCKKWSGVAHFSECLQPLESFDCMSCKQFLVGTCGFIGVLGKEILTAFFTGGLLTAAKHGIEGSQTIAKVLKTSKALQESIKKVKVKPRPAGAAATKTAVAMNAINAYLLSPAREITRAAFLKVEALMKTAPVAMVISGTNKTLVFSYKAAEYTVKGIMMPLSNPLTDKAFRAGIKTFDKVFKFGAPKLTVKGPAATALTATDDTIEPLLAEIELNRLAGAMAKKQTIHLEKQLFDKVKPLRKDLSTKALQNEPDLDDVINYLYPELRYGELAKTLPRTSILQAEKELARTIGSLPKGSARTKLLKELQEHISNNEARAKVVGLGQK